MIDNNLVKYVQGEIDKHADLHPQKAQELLTNYIAMIESDAALRKRLAQFNSSLNAIGAHIQKSSPQFAMGGVDGNDIFSSSGAIIEYIKKLEGKDKVKNWIPLGECKHSNITHKMNHVKCSDCGKIKTDGGWGIARRMWFDNLESARFYLSNGFLPKL